MAASKAWEQLRDVLPLGMIATKQWLLEQGLSLHLLDNAVRSQTLRPLTSGVYALYEPKVSWQGVVASLQRMSDDPVHVGGASALQLSGRGHYLSSRPEAAIQLFAEQPLPRWLSRLSVNAVFEWHGTRRLWPPETMENSRFLRQETWREGLPPVQFSGSEKAMFETLGDVPRTVSFEYVDALMQGLPDLSPRKLDALLLACRSIKAKRLFFWLAERHEHAWYKHLKPDHYDLGSGKRVVAKDGKLSQRWQITVPGDR